MNSDVWQTAEGEDNYFSLKELLDFTGYVWLIFLLRNSFSNDAVWQWC